MLIFQNQVSLPDGNQELLKKDRDMCFQDVNNVKFPQSCPLNLKMRPSPASVAEEIQLPLDHLYRHPTVSQNSLLFW